MQRRALILGAAALALAACSRNPAPAPEAAAPDPASAIAPLYQPYLTDGPFPALENEAPWSASLREALVAMMARSQAANEPILDFDPITGAQDYQLSALAVTTEAIVPGSHATVRAHFLNLGQEQEVVYDMVWEGETWRVDNIRGADWDLRQVIAQGA